MKKLLIFILMTIFTFGLFSCGNKDNGDQTTSPLTTTLKQVAIPQRINIPQNLKYENNIISWDDEEKADYYLLSINDVEHKIEETSYQLDSSLYEGEILEIKVLAGNKSNNIADSRYSDSIVVNIPGGMSEDDVRNQLSSEYSSNVIDKIMTVAKANNICSKNIVPLVDIFHMFINGESESICFDHISSSGRQINGFLIDYLDQVYTSGELNYFFQVNREKMVKVLSSLYAFDNYKKTDEYINTMSVINDFPKAQSNINEVRDTRNDILSMVERFVLDESDIDAYVEAFYQFLSKYGYKFNLKENDALTRSKVIEYLLYNQNYSMCRYALFCLELSDDKISSFCESEAVPPILDFYCNVVSLKEYQEIAEKSLKLEYDHLEYITDDSAGLSTQINQILSQLGKVRIDLAAFMNDFKKEISFEEYKKIDSLNYKYISNIYTNETLINNYEDIIKTKGGKALFGEYSSYYESLNKSLIEDYQLLYQVKKEVYSNVTREDLEIYFNYCSVFYKALSKEFINGGLNVNDFTRIRDGLAYTGNRITTYLDETIDFCFESFLMFDNIISGLEKHKDNSSYYKNGINGIVYYILADYGYNGIDGTNVIAFIDGFNSDSENRQYIEEQAQFSYQLLFLA